MNHYEQFAAKGERGSRDHRHLLIRSHQRAPVNVYKTESSYEMLVFAPGRIKEHFHLDLKGNQLTVSYSPPEGFPRPDWIMREYSRGGFIRTFNLDESVNGESISAKYLDGVLQISMPLIPGQQTAQREIQIA